jgi:hypothetical protein
MTIQKKIIFLALALAAAVFAKVVLVPKFAQPDVAVDKPVITAPPAASPGPAPNFAEDQDIPFDPRAATVAGIGLSTSLADLKKSFGDEAVSELTNDSELDGPEKIIELNFGADRTITIYPDRGAAEIFDPSFVTPEGLRVGMVWSEFERAYGCDPKSWEGGEISRAICAEGVLVGTSEQPQAESTIESILITLNP